MSYTNKTGLSRLWGHVLSKLLNKVDKVDGKGLSTCDYTAEEKESVTNVIPAQITDLDSRVTQVSATANKKQHSLFLNDKPSLYAQPNDVAPYVTLYDTNGKVNYSLGAGESGVSISKYADGVWQSTDYVYSPLNKPSPGDIGAAVSSHTHNAIKSDGGVVFVIANGSTPGIAMEYAGKSQFALSRASLSNQTLGYHMYDDNGAWAAYHTLFSTANLPSSAQIPTGGTQGQICAVNADGTISPNATTIDSVFSTTNLPTSAQVVTNGSEGQICAVNADGTITPNARTIASLGTGATYTLDGTTLYITTL